MSFEEAYDWTKTDDQDLEAELARRAGSKTTIHGYRPRYLDPISGFGLLLRDFGPMLKEKKLILDFLFYADEKGAWGWGISIGNGLYEAWDTNLARAMALAILAVMEVRSKLSPEDVFSEIDLEEWAKQNGYEKATEE